MRARRVVTNRRPVESWSMIFFIRISLFEYQASTALIHKQKEKVKHTLIYKEIKMKRTINSPKINKKETV